MHWPENQHGLEIVALPCMLNPPQRPDNLSSANSVVSMCLGKSEGEHRQNQPLFMSTLGVPIMPPNAPFAELVRLSRTSITDEMREEHRRSVLGDE